MVLSLLTGVGWLWLFLNSRNPGNGTTLCLFKNVTGFPCPSCGSTRALLHILQGDLTGALSLNPIGFLLMITLSILPFWITADYIRKQKTLERFVIASENMLHKKPIILTLILITISINWVWNIYKDL
jgi:hypothetical protein